MDRVYFLVYRTVLYVVFRSVGPLLILVVLNARLATALSVIRRRRRRLLSTGARRARASRSNTTTMLLVVVSTFVVCELPDVGLRLAVTVYEFQSAVRLHLDAVRHAHIATNALHVVNASVNFVIYCLVGHRFRRILGRRLTECRAPAVSVSDEAPEDWAGGTPAGGAGSECEHVAMAAAAAQPTTDQCVVVVHRPNTALASAVVMATNAD